MGQFEFLTYCVTRRKIQTDHYQESLNKWLGFIAHCYNRGSFNVRQGSRNGKWVAQESTGDEFCWAGYWRK